MSQLATLHIDKQAHKFSAAHFTIFSETERERLHGHNYGVSARIVAEMGDNGFSADYNVYKRCLQKICDAHDEYMLLPSKSPWLSVAERDGEYHATFAGKTLRFPVDETLLLPIVNVTVEALANYLLSEVLATSWSSVMPRSRRAWACSRRLTLTETAAPSPLRF